MKEYLSLTILSPSGVIIKEEVSEVYVPSKDGPIGILRGHTPLIAELAPLGVLRYQKNGAYTYVRITHGVVEVKPDELVILTQSGEIIDDKEATSFS